MKEKICNSLRTMFKPSYSLIWSILLGFCLVSPISDVFTAPVLVLILWLPAVLWVRIIRREADKRSDVFIVTPSNLFESSFVFISGGILRCYLLGRDLAHGCEFGVLLCNAILIVMGALYAATFVFCVLIEIDRQRSQFEKAASAMLELSTYLTDDDSEYFSIAAQCNDGAEKVVHWMKTDHGPYEGSGAAEK